MNIFPHLSENIATKIKSVFASFFWFFVGFFFAAIVLGGIVIIYFQKTYKDKVIPGVFVDNIYVGEKTKEEVSTIFNNKNERIRKNIFEIKNGDSISTISAQALKIGYDSDLIAEQALSLGKSNNVLSDFSIFLTSYLHGIFLHSKYSTELEQIKKTLDPFYQNVHKEPVDALFSVENNRVIAFKESQNGQTIDYEKLQNSITNVIPEMINAPSYKVYRLSLPLKILEPTVSTEKANSFGIVEVIGSGMSYFYHSIPNRIYNISLAASRVNGILVAPDEEFSFVKYLGDVSRLTGYKEAYVIQGGRTVLGDGGGVCQVSSTLFRSLLDAGLPITERTAHSYRVEYYEQGPDPWTKPGFDATVFYPSVDLKFKNDTGNYILIVSSFDEQNMSLTYTLYGKKDGREVAISTPIIKSQTPPPPALYQDDPTLPKGQTKQVDFAAWGANVVFNRTVAKNGKVIINDTYNSRYSPWQAVFLKGTKE